MRLATRRLLAHYEAHMAGTGLNVTQFGLMSSIASTPAPSISELAESIELSPSTLTRTLRPLEKAGLIETFADPENRRLRRVRVTHEGRARLRTAVAAWAEAQREAAAIVPTKLVNSLLAATEKLPR